MRVKTEDRRRAIMHAALGVFREVGYERASMSEIAARLGGSKATLYGYFQSKEELFATAMLELHSNQVEAFLGKLDLSRDNYTEVLDEFGRAYLEHLMKIGVLRPAEPGIAALHLQGLLEAGIVEPRLYGAKPLLTIEHAASLAVKIFLRAYAKGPGE